MSAFKDGFDYFCDNNIGQFAANQGREYVESVDDEITKLLEQLKEYEGYKTGVAQLKGNVAENWLAGTFNIEAAKNMSNHRAEAIKVNGLGSVDIDTNFGKQYGLKFYANADKSAEAQSISIFQRFKEYRNNGGKLSLNAYLENAKISDDVMLSDPLYAGQIRIIPEDQYNDAVKWLKEKIAKEKVIRPDEVKRYQDTLDSLETVISDGKGNKSRSLTEKQARELALASRDGKIDIEGLELTANQVIKIKDVMKQAAKAGLTTALMEAIVKAAPGCYRAITYLIETGEIDIDEFKEAGMAAIKGGAEGFVIGAVTGALTDVLLKNALSSGAKSGIQSVTPSLVSALVVFTVDTIKDSYLAATGKLTKRELTDRIFRNFYVTSLATASGVVAEYFLKIPYVAYMLGSLVGSIIGSVTYSLASKVTVALCLDTGFTLFGLVEQDYTFPENVMREMGVDVFDFDRFVPDEFLYDRFEADRFVADSFIPERIELITLRRGVLGVGYIGYI